MQPDLSKLNQMQLFVTQQGGTEPPFSGTLLYNTESGLYHCLVCQAPLFSSQAKFDAGCGWPSFYQAINPDAIRYLEDNSRNMQRTEIRCARCDAHLGHVFSDGPYEGGQRYCVNSVSLTFNPQDSEAPVHENGKTR